jgi:uncharacterized protein with gpF-like domain
MTPNELALHYDRFYRRYEKKYEKRISREIRKQILSYLDGDINSVSSDGITKAIQELHLDAGMKWAKEINLYSRTFKRDRFSDYMFPLLRTYMVMDSINVGEQITETTIEYIKDLLYQATILNWSLQYLRNELLRIKYIRMRGLLITRTELTYSTNVAAYLVMGNQAQNKRWISILDSRTRRDHRMLNGQVRDINEPFQVVNKYGVTVRMNYPGDRSLGAGADQICNCRCFMVYE